MSLQEQAQQELIRRQALQELAKRELARRQTVPTGTEGFVKNLRTDFGTFAKGLLGMGRQAVTHPVQASKKIYGVGKEIVKGIPQGVRDMGRDLANAPSRLKEGYGAFKQLRKIPFDTQQKAIDELIRRVGKSKGNADQKTIAQMGASVLGSYGQLTSRPRETFYKRPFTSTLDVLPATKALGAGKAISKVAKPLKATEAYGRLTDAFTPMGKMKRMGYGDVAEDLMDTQTKMRKLQQESIESTIHKFDKEFKLSKAEREEFFDTIDSLRRSNEIPKSANPKVQTAIDWWLNEELPKVQKTAGYKPLDPLAKEAKKYKTPDEFIKAKQKDIVYHGSNKPLEKFDDRGAFFTDDMMNADGYAGGENVYEGFLDLKNPLIIDAKGRHHSDLLTKYGKSTQEVVSNVDRKKYDGVIFKNINDSFADDVDVAGTDKIFYPFNANKSFKNEDQLRKIWKKASEQPPIQNYLHHFFSPTKETQFGSKLASPERGFLKRSKDVEGFSKDPVVSISAIKSKAGTANLKDAFVNRVFEKYGKTNVKEYKSGKIIDLDTGEQLMKYKGKYLPKDLGEELTKFESKSPSTIDTVLAPFRAFNRNWKPLATAVRPRYHLRNVLGNVYNASFVGGGNLKHYFKAGAEQIKNHIATSIKDGTIAGKFYKGFFKKAPETKYIKQAIDDDVVGRGFFGVDINDVAEIADKTEDFGRAVEKVKNPALIYKIPVLRQWMDGMQKFGQAVEDNARLALYIDRLKKGATRAEAKAYVNKHLFDYLTGLGEADQIIKAFIPFWSWTRFNIPLQLGAIGKMPLRHLAVQRGSMPYVQAQEAQNPEYQYLSDREKEMGAIKIGEVEKDGHTLDKYMRTQSVLPIQDVSRLTDPDSVGFSPAFSMLEQAYRSVIPPEQPEANLNYWGRPVEQYPGERKNYLGMPVRGTHKEILQSIPIISELNKLFGGSYTESKRPDLATRIETVISPTSTTLQDREKNREYAQMDYNKRIKGTYSMGYETAFKSIVKKIIESPDSDKALMKNREVLIGLLKQQGYTEPDIQAQVLKAIDSLAKQKTPPMPNGRKRYKNNIQYEALQELLRRQYEKGIYN